MESVRADFYLRELPCYLSNTYEILPLLLKCIGEQDSVNIFCRGYNLLQWQPDFRRHFSQVLTFLTFFLLINDFFRTIAKSLS